MTSKPEDVCRKFSFNIIKKCEGVIDYKIIREIYHKIQANAPTIQSDLARGYNGLLGLEMQPATYPNLTGHGFQSPDPPPQVVPVPANAAAAEDPGNIQHHATQVDQWRQLVNMDEILKQQLLESLDEKYFKWQHQEYITYSNCTLTGLIQDLYDDHGEISLMNIEESEHKMKQKWLLIYTIVELFLKMKKEWI